jgi:hypothetical protein
MATRRTTMRSRSGKKLYAVRDESGQFKDIQTYQRAHAADLRHKSEDEKTAAQGPIEKRVRKAATAAVKSVKASVGGAVDAVQRLAKKTIRKASELRHPKAKTAMTTATRKPVAKKATTRKAAAKRTGKKAR